jgi:hypothetical protein
MTTSTPISNKNSAGATRNGVAEGAPKLLLRLEGAAACAAAVYFYVYLSGGWSLFALLFFAPDIFMLGYLAGPSIGSAVYNIGHTYLSPVALALLGLVLGQPMLLLVALIWVSHVGFDRAVGYGLKYKTSFQHTHLGLPFGGKAEA